MALSVMIIDDSRAMRRKLSFFLRIFARVRPSMRGIIQSSRIKST
jgi:hypothetical protein